MLRSTPAIARRSSMLLTSAAAIVLASSVTGCGDESANPVPEPGARSATFDAGPFTVDPGAELVMCTYARSDNDEAEDITAFDTEQSVGGHHLIVYTMDHAVDLPPTACSQGGQPSWNQILATQVEAEHQEFPAGVGFHIAPHQQFVLETHYINTTTGPLEVNSQFATTFAAKGSVTERAATYFFGSLNIDIPPSAAWSTTASCKPPRDMTLRTMFGHEHRRGTGVDAGLLLAGASEELPLYHTTEWEAPPVQAFADGQHITTNDSVRVTCDWQNDGSERLRYPHEMCFAIGYYWPAEGSLVCTAGGGKDDCECMSQGTLDTGPGGSTVSITASRAETIDGALGDIDKGAPIYCSLWRSEDWAGFFPKAGAQPYYFRDAIDVPLTTTEDEATFTVNDVTPGEYVAVCMMDTIGGGFMPGTGDVVNMNAPKVTAVAGQTAHADVVLDFAVP